jgi:hypothetical protein
VREKKGRKVADRARGRTKEIEEDRGVDRERERE